MFEILQDIWELRGIQINYLDIYWDFKRNIPIELMNEAKINQMLLGTISDKQRLSLLSFIDDPEWEIEEMRGMIDLDEVEEE